MMPFIHMERIGKVNLMAMRSKLLFGTLTWTLDATTPTESSPRTNAYDGDRSTAFNFGGSCPSKDGHCYSTLTMNFSKPIRVLGMYAKGSGASEQGGCVCNDRHDAHVNVNGSVVGYFTGGQSQVVDWTDSTNRPSVSSADCVLNTWYSRPENNGGFSYIALYEFEMQTVL